MKRIFGAGLLALPLLLTAAQESRAQAPAQSCPQPATSWQRNCAFFGVCGPAQTCGCCFRFLGAIHQNGPLFNYGPYYGYYPFEPYGPWNAQLQYTGPRPGDLQPSCGPIGLCGKCGGYHGLHAGCGGAGWGAGGGGAAGCSAGAGWGTYAKTTWTNVFHRVHPLAYRRRGTAGCSTCGSATGTIDGTIISGNITERPSEIETTGYPRRER
ncbi:hypothetical protein [Fimbriiglobus ruber]|uniref:Uncharacterized protein n=1 Tax=Fimbriiglobus ruber TaxID=1908690 RepID=A0A225DQT3_9BACT|nr:hypothetical protein [Fimbriiglobus ruber]OWK43830.1 hypothetical protein FRUB_03429 [Fimbriiglobus ruber]